MHQFVPQVGIIARTVKTKTGFTNSTYLRRSNRGERLREQKVNLSVRVALSRLLLHDH